MITTLLFKTDKKLKERAQGLAREMGLPLSAILNQQLRRFVEERGIEFRAPLVVNKKMKAILAKRVRDAKQKKNMSPEFSCASDALKWLNAKGND